MRCLEDFVRCWPRTKCWLLEFFCHQHPIELLTHHDVMATRRGLHFNNNGGVSLYYCHCWNYDSWIVESCACCFALPGKMIGVLLSFMDILMEQFFKWGFDLVGDTRVGSQLVCICGKVVSLLLMHWTILSSLWGEFDTWSLFDFGETYLWYRQYSADTYWGRATIAWMKSHSPVV